MSIFTDLYASTRTLFPHILAEINEDAGPQFAFAITAIEDELNSIITSFKQAVEEEVPFKQFHLEKHTITLLQSEVKLHRDKAHKSVKRIHENYSFLEYNLIFAVPSATNSLL